MDPAKLMALIAQLRGALDERNTKPCCGMGLGLLLSIRHYALLPEIGRRVNTWIVGYLACCLRDIGKEPNLAVLLWLELSHTSAPTI